MQKRKIFLLIFLLSGCSQEDKVPNTPLSPGEYIYRHSHDDTYLILPPKAKQQTPYPWEENS